MPHDHLVRKKALLDYKNWILRSYQIGIVLKGLSHDFGQKIKILSLFVSGKNGPGNNVLMIIEVENKPSQTIKIWISHRCRICLF